MSDQKPSPILTAAPETIRVLPTPLYVATSAACLTNAWCDWLGYTVPESYTSLAQELDALKEHAGLMDISPLGKYVVTGRDIAAYMEHTFVASLDGVEVGHSVLSPFCQSNGKTINIAEISHLAEQYWWINVPGRHLHWLEEAAIGFDVEVRDLTEAYAGVCLTGPASGEILDAIGLGGLRDLPQGRAMHLALDDLTLIVTRPLHESDTGYSLWCSADKGEAFWTHLSEAGRSLGLLPVGRHAATVRRIEVGLPEAGAEFVSSPQARHNDRRHSPIALGFQGYIDFSKPAFNGRAALQEELARERSLRLVQLTFEGSAPPPGTHIFEKTRLPANLLSQPIGIITSSTTLPDRASALALGLLKPDIANPGQEVFVEYQETQEAVIQKAGAAGRIVTTPQFTLLP